MDGNRTPQELTAGRQNEALLPLVGLFGVLVLVLAGPAAEHLGQRIPNAAHKQGAEQILEGHERVVDAEQDG